MCLGIVVLDIEDVFFDEVGMGFYSVLGVLLVISIFVVVVDLFFFGFDNENVGDGILGGVIKLFGDDMVDFLINVKM